MSEIDPPEDLYEKDPERPLECTECKKPISVFYTEIVGNCVTRTGMCADCPNLKKRLQGIPNASFEGSHSGATAGLACGNCGTILDSIYVGTPLGCNVCYEVFDDILFGELLSSGKIPSRINHNKKSTPIHIGRSPGSTVEISPTLRLVDLNDALSETLKKEDYEQAAWLRDQIKALTEKKQPSDKEEKERENDGQ